MTHYTTLEQSKKLVELGLNPDTADMVIVKENTYCNALSAFNGVTLCQNYNETKDKTNYIPCWSLGALLDVMPEQITYSYFEPFPLGFFKGSKEEYSKYGHYWIQYFCTKHGGAYIQTNGHTTIEAAYNMVCWLLENGYIKKGEGDGNI